MDKYLQIAFINEELDALIRHQDQLVSRSHPLSTADPDGCVHTRPNQDVALSHRMARPSMDYCDEGNLIFFPEATHWLQLDEAESVHHRSIFLLDKISTQVIR